jgi:RHS repeat-associated protein
VAALTTLLYSGEQTDSTGLQYLRARYYNPNTGRFNRLDPFFGDLNDPQSLHKYLYSRGDPILLFDPTGLTAWGAMIGLGIGIGYNAAVMGVGTAAAWDVYKIGVWYSALLYSEIDATTGSSESIARAEIHEVAFAAFTVSHAFLPAYDGKHTWGVLVPLDPPGITRVVLSGELGPAQRAPSGRGSEYDGYTRTHAEGHAAQLMRENGIRKAVLTINHVNGVCRNCNQNLKHMLPLGAWLLVLTPSATVPRPGWVINPPPYIGQP